MLLYGWAFVIMRHDSECSMLFSRTFLMCLLSSFEFLRYGYLSDAVLSVSSLEVIFSKSNVRFSGVIVLACNCGLVDH